MTGWIFLAVLLAALVFAAGCVVWPAPKHWVRRVIDRLERRGCSMGVAVFFCTLAAGVAVALWLIFVPGRRG